MSVDQTILSVTAAAESRRSIRKYTDEPIPREHIDEILRVAGLAPSPWNVQPWRVIVVTDPEEKQKLMGAAYGQPQVGAAAAVFVIASDMTDALAKIEDTVHPGMADRLAQEAADRRAYFEKMGPDATAAWGNAEANIFLGFLLLAIEAHGYSSSPMLGFAPDQVRALYGLGDHVQFPALVAVGKKAEDGFPHHRHPLDRYVTYK